MIVLNQSLEQQEIKDIEEKYYLPFINPQPKICKMSSK